MLQIPPEMARQYTHFLRKKGVAINRAGYYLKWLRYYLDFCNRYDFKTGDRKGLSAFLEKLEEKKQAESLIKQAHHAISLFCEMGFPSPGNSSNNTTRKTPDIVCSTNPPSKSSSFDQKKPRGISSLQPFSSKNNTIHGNLVHNPDAVEGPEKNCADWTEVFTELKNAIKIRHYSPRTLKSYSSWVRKFQAHIKSKDPSLISIDDVKNFLTWLATDQGVSASSQNQAFNALLFLFRNVFHKEFGKVDGIVRAKRKPYIPVVLSREEVHDIIGFMRHPHDLITSLMYGCGLRISECLSLRVNNFNFDMGILTIHDGKGQKDRTVPIPMVLMDDLKGHLQRVIALHEKDCKNGYDGVFLYGLLEKKYKNAAKELIWQWFFPAENLTFVPETHEQRRYHVHETSLQKAIRRAVKKASIPKRVTAHTFRHSFASHLLQANYDIRTIQQLLGHSDVRTTMIYTHTVKSRTLKEAMSPLDL